MLSLDILSCRVIRIDDGRLAIWFVSIGARC